jgi:long-chain acyl-CoA synthetase
MPGVTITLKPVDGIEGESGRVVHVSGPAVSRGYASLEADGSDMFVDGGFVTGDLAFFDASGSLVLTGRVSSFVNVAGRKVQPEEVARCLRAMPELADARVVGAPCPLRGEQLVAVVVSTDIVPSVTAMRSFCATRLAPFKVPREFVVVSHIPVDVRGKTDRRALEELVAAHLARPLRTRD